MCSWWKYRLSIFYPFSPPPPTPIDPRGVPTFQWKIKNDLNVEYIKLKQSYSQKTSKFSTKVNFGPDIPVFDVFWGGQLQTPRTWGLQLEYAIHVLGNALHHNIAYFGMGFFQKFLGYPPLLIYRRRHTKVSGVCYYCFTCIEIDFVL